MKIIEELLIDSPLLSTEENNRLAFSAKKSKEDLELFVRCNIKLAVKIITQLNIPVTEDSVMAAVTGLLTAVINYDKKKGNITTYMRFRIMEELFNMLGADEPIYYSSTYKKARRKYNKLRSLNEYENLSEEVKKQVLKIEGVSEKNQRLIEKTEEYTFCSYDEAEFSYLTNEYSVEDDIIDRAMKEELKKSVDLCMKKLLSEKEEYVICKFYGIDCEKSSLSKICDQMNLSRESVRKLRNRALKKMSGSPILAEMNICMI